MKEIRKMGEIYGIKGRRTGLILLAGLFASLMLTACTVNISTKDFGNPENGSLVAGSSDAASGEGAYDDDLDPRYRKAIKSFKLEEPEYIGDAGNGKPEFHIKWTDFPDAIYYETAIYAEGTDTYGRGDFAIRSTKGAYGAATEQSIIFLQGVYTDTVTYRIKVRPEIRDENNRSVYKDRIWTNIWEVKFTDGEYSITATDKDFDEEIAKAQNENASSDRKDGKTQKAIQEKAEKTEPLPHSYPEPLLLYLAKEQGREEAFSPSDIAGFSVNINECEQGYPAQFFSGDESTDRFAEAVSEMTVEGESDAMWNTEGETFYSAQDSDGNRLFYFALFQGKYLEGSDGALFNLGGVLDLASIKGVMSAADWTRYYNEFDDKSYEYEYAIEEDPSGIPLIEASYGISLLEQAGPESIQYMTAYIDWNREVEELKSYDGKEQEAVFRALEDIRIGDEVQNPKGDMWHISFDYMVPGHNFYDSAFLKFKGDCVEVAGSYYKVPYIKKLYDSVDCGMFRYMRDYSEAPMLKPVY